MAKKKETISPSSKNETTMGQRIEYLKRENSLNDEQIGNIFTPAAPKSLVYYWQKDERQPSLARLITMAQYFDVPLLWLLLGRDMSKATTHFHRATEALMATEFTCAVELKSVEGKPGTRITEEEYAELDILLSDTIQGTVRQFMRNRQVDDL